MKYRVMVNVTVNPYIIDADNTPSDQVSYTQNLMFSDSMDVETKNWTELGKVIDAVVEGILHAIMHSTIGEEDIK